MARLEHDMNRWRCYEFEQELLAHLSSFSMATFGGKQPPSHDHLLVYF